MAGGQQFQLTRDVLWVSHGTESVTLKEGTVCEYDADLNIYVFDKHRTIDGHIVKPWYPAKVVEAWGFWFEPRDQATQGA